jgi:hypothetical protein
MRSNRAVSVHVLDVSAGRHGEEPKATARPSDVSVRADLGLFPDLCPMLSKESFKSRLSAYMTHGNSLPLGRLSPWRNLTHAMTRAPGFISRLPLRIVLESVNAYLEFVSARSRDRAKRNPTEQSHLLRQISLGRIPRMPNRAW